MTRAATPETAQRRADGRGECVAPRFVCSQSPKTRLGSGPSQMLVIMRKVLIYRSLTKLKSHKFYADLQHVLWSFSLFFDRKVPYARLFAPPSRVCCSHSPIFIYFPKKTGVIFGLRGKRKPLQCFFRRKVGQSPAGSLFSPEWNGM